MYKVGNIFNTIAIRKEREKERIEGHEFKMKMHVTLNY